VLSIVDSGTTALLSLAIDAATLRHQALAQNIANASTPGYQRVSVSFEERVGALLDRHGQLADTSPARLASLRPYFQTLDSGSAENNVSLDMEVAAMSENTLHHQALLKALNKHFALLGLAMNDGKR